METLYELHNYVQCMRMFRFILISELMKVDCNLYIYLINDMDK